MVRLLGLIIALLLAAPLAAMAQAPVVPAPPYYAVGPNQPLNSQPVSPVQQQVLQNYRSQLLQTQHELLQQNPAGTSRDQLEINRQLNGYNSPPPVTYTPPPLPGAMTNPAAGR